MRTLLAQVSPERLEAVCGPSQAFWMCETVLETTGNELLARVAGAANVVLRIAIILVVAWVAMRMSRRAVGRFARRMERRINERLDRGEARGVLKRADNYRDRRLRRLQAITGVAQGVAAALVWVIAILAVVDAFGVSLQPVLAGAGLLGIVVGFGAQQLVRDVLAGIAMLIEDQYGVGDWIDVDGKIGEVERVGLRATSFRDLDGIQWHVLNGYIQRVGNLSQEWGRMTFDIPVALDTDVPSAKALISRVATELTHDPVWRDDIIGPHEIWGVQEFGPEGLAIRCVIPTRPMANWDIKRQMRERINHAFAQAGIRQPGTLHDVGGRPDGHHAVPWERREPGPGPQVRREGIVPPGTGPLDEPPTGARPEREAPSEGAGEPAAEAGAPERDATTRIPVQPRDETTELRIRRGAQPRPD